jgi:isopentenyl-diphosphate Delta-isomerase
MEDRKKAHIDLAFKSRVIAGEADGRFNYEPLLAAHPSGTTPKFAFAGKTMRLPVWVSSMTGGTALAGQINRNLAQACAEFGLGMGLGSCRILLDDNKYLSDFDVRHILGQEAPFYANIGIAQLEALIDKGASDKIDELVHKLKADGIIIHVNPLQEAFQPEGDVFLKPPIETIRQFLETSKTRVIVKEVGQGMGPESLKQLMKLPIEAIEFGALGGTNFTKLELSRQDATGVSILNHFGKVGHTAEEMTAMLNNLVESEPELKCNQVIISGGIRNILDGYYLINTSALPSVFGMGSAFLEHATEDYESLRTFVQQIEKSLSLAERFLTIKKQR